MMLLAVSVQGMAAITAGMRGPAHFHAAIEAAAASAATRAVHSHHARHSHAQVRHHYHLPGSDAVRIAEHSHDDPGTAAKRTPKGESASAAFVAVISEPLVLTPPDATLCIGSGGTEKLLSCTPRRIERPPRSLPA